MNATSKPVKEMTAIECLAEIFGDTVEEVEASFAPLRRREAEGWQFDRSHLKAAMYWGNGPLPTWSNFEGTIRRPDGRIGALIHLRRTNVYVQGNAGSITSLDQEVINDILEL